MDNYIKLKDDSLNYRIIFHPAWILLILIQLSNSLAGQQTFEWVRNDGGFYNDEGKDLAVDKHGNLYITGDVDPNAWFGSINLGDATAFIAKYDNQGKLLWVKGIICNEARSNAIALDSLGNSYVVGAIWDTAYIQSDTLIPRGGHDFFMAKYDTQGNLIWTRTGGSSSLTPEDKLIDVEVFNSKYVYVRGVGASDTVGNHVSLYDLDGNWIWTRSGVSKHTVFIAGLDIDSMGNAYAGGAFIKSIQFGDSTYLAHNSSTPSTFLVKYDTLGNLHWVKRGDSINFTQSIDVAGIDKGGCLLVGRRRTSLGAVSPEIFVSKYDINGNILWTKNIGDHSNEMALSVEYNTVTKEVYVSGFSSLDTSAGVGYSTKAFIHCLDSMGAEVWGYRVGTDQDVPFAFENVINAMEAVDEKIYFTGTFKGNINLWPWQLSSNGHADIIVGKAHLSSSFTIKETNQPELPIKYYPNPVTDILTIVFKNDRNYSIEVRGAGGKVLMRTQNMSSRKIELDFKPMPKGVYQIIISNTFQNFCIKITKT